MMREHETQDDRDDTDVGEGQEPDRERADQAEMRRRYLEQLRRISYPGCGEEPFTD